MKNFTLSEMLIVSERERTARRLQFGPGLTVIEGPNDTGKSAVIKSIYWTLGADPEVMPRRWLDASPTVVLKARIDDEPITFLRKDRIFAAYNAEGKVLGRFQSVTNDLAPFLAEKFDFGLRLPNRQNELAVPTPAYMFLPFYIDQDISWMRQWSAFARLQQFPNWRGAVIEYHVGIRDSRWYRVEQGIADAKEHLNTRQGELKVLRRMRAAANEDRQEIEFSVDVDAFKTELDELLDNCNRLYAQERDFQRRYAAASEERRRLLEQIKTVELAVAELSADRKYASHHGPDDHVECPTCGAEYENSFGVRFAIAQDEARLTDFLAELRGDVAAVDITLEAVAQDLRGVRTEQTAIERILAASRDDVTLGEIITTRGRLEFRALLRANTDEAIALAREAESRIDALQRERRRLNKENKKHRNRIEADHAERMRRYFRELNIVTLGEEALRLHAHVADSGSGQPRALLAYFFSVLALIREYGTGVFAPILVDEPNQQGQDGVNMEALLQFIVNHRPPGSQMILGIESDHGVDLPGERIHFRDKLAALSRSEFSTIRDEAADLLSAALL